FRRKRVHVAKTDIEVGVELVLTKTRDGRDWRQPRRRARGRNRKCATREFAIQDRDGDWIRDDAERRLQPGGAAVVVAQLRRNERKQQTVVERSTVRLSRSLVRAEKEDPVEPEWTTKR